MNYDAEPAEMGSLGLLLFTLLTGKFPFTDPYAVAAGPDRIRRTVEGKISQDYAKILDGLLMRNLELRCDLDALVNARWWKVTV